MKMFIEFQNDLFNLNHIKYLSLHKNCIHLYSNDHVSFEFNNEEKAKNAFDKIIVGLSTKNEIVLLDE